MKKIILVSLLTCFSVLSYASGTVTFLEVEEDVVLFSISDSKTGNSPSCVAVGNDELWSLSLSNDSGRAIYSLMLTSMASDEVGLTVESANDCGVVTGIERASKVTLSASASTISSPTGGFGLYDGEGNRIGPIIEFSAINTWWYIDESGSDYPQTYSHKGRATLYYLEEACQGQPYMSSASGNVYNMSYLNGHYIKVVSSTRQDGLEYKSYLNGNKGAECVEQERAMRLFELELDEDELCGSHACSIRPE